ncbi:MAG: dehydrogenase E1 component subunit alpha/beta [Vicinamibacterales bacterium]|nr:dehydrogenase E1 component subunit alpha/beta [Vicinamibacterales bacterium]HJO16660.1 dehydrogenase E1 component subunit alpha/beta [Vicinamibacterales bacterium]|tara:strand:- start:86 stop:2236 length:2151 start_codon:yes stop_codon:yes gene_type:complete
MSFKGQTPSSSTRTAATPPRRETVELSQEQLLRAYRTMRLSRRLDDKEIQLKNQSIAYFQISAAGHEAIQVAIGFSLRPGYDWIFPYYRDRALCLTLGVTPTEMLLGSVGSSDDPSSGGRQMPSHWSDRLLHIVSPSSATGTQCLHGVGCAEGGVLNRTLGTRDGREPSAHADEVILVSLGDGATSEGEFWESLNTACTQQLPVVFLVQDNGYAISVPVDIQTPGGSISKLLESFPSLRIARADGTDLLDSWRAAQDAVDHVRAHRGPALVHAHTTRPYSHSHSDDERVYKTQAERDSETVRDPLVRFREFCLANSVATNNQLNALDSEVEDEIAAATDGAIKAPSPVSETVTRYIYSPDVDPCSKTFDVSEKPSGEPKTMVSAINQTLKDEMARNSRMVVFGQDVADSSHPETLSEVRGKGGVFKVTESLQRTFGAERVFNSPLAEANIVGRAMGMAIRGIKPVVEIQFFDYIWSATMQLRNEVAMLRYRSNNTYSCPMVVRVPIGGYLRGGSIYHSQSGEGIFAHFPGLRIAYPSNAADACGLLRTAIRCDDPVLFLEHKHLYRQTYNKAAYPGVDHMVPFGQSVLRRSGSDVVIITWGALVQRSLAAAQQAEKLGIAVSVLDLRTIMPYDWEGIAEAVAQTNRVVVAHEDQLTCGFGAELVARMADELFDSLDAPVKRVAALDCPVGYNPVFEEVVLPQAADIVRAIQDVVNY